MKPGAYPSKASFCCSILRQAPALSTYIRQSWKGATTTLSIMPPKKRDTQQNDTLDTAELSVVRLSVVWLNVVMLSVVDMEPLERLYLHTLD